MSLHRFIIMTLVILGVVCVGFPAWAADTPQATGQVRFVAAGSGVNLGITRLLADAFIKKNPNISIEVPGSIGTGGAIKAAADGAISLGLISRPLTDAEKALGIVEQPYARTAIVIGAHASVQDDTITTQELNEIFKGTKTKWKNGSQIIVQARDKSDSGFLVLQNAIPGFKAVYVESWEAKRWTIYFNDQDANKALSTIPNAIGVTDLGMIATEQLNVKILKLNGIAPDPENVLNGTYPLSRQLSFIFRPATVSAEAKAFLDFTSSEEGRGILRANGYLPLP